MIERDPDLIAGRRFHDARRWDLAERYLRAGLARWPGSAEDHAYLAGALLGQDRLWEARLESDEALRLAPRSPAVLAARIEILDGVGDGGGAVRAARDLVALCPDSSSALAMLSYCLFRKGRPRAALETAERAMALDPDDIDALNSRALALSALGRPDEAELTLRDALRRSPDTSVLHNNIGHMLMRQGRIAPARGSFLESLRIDPASHPAAVNLRLSRNPLVRALMVVYGGFVRGLRRWGRWPVGAQVGLIIGLVLGGLAWPGGPGAALLVLLWSISGWLRRFAPELTARIGRAIERVPLMMVSLPSLGAYYVFNVTRLFGPAAGLGSLLGFMLPLVLGFSARDGADDPVEAPMPWVDTEKPAPGHRVNVIGSVSVLAAAGLALTGAVLPWAVIYGPGSLSETIYGAGRDRGQFIEVVAVIALVAGLARLPATGQAGWRRGAAIAGGFGMVAAAAPVIAMIVDGDAIASPFSASLGAGLPFVVVAGFLAVGGGLVGGGTPLRGSHGRRPIESPVPGVASEPR